MEDRINGYSLLEQQPETYTHVAISICQHILHYTTTLIHSRKGCNTKQQS